MHCLAILLLLLWYSYFIMTLSQELEARGFIYQTSTDSIADILDGGTRTVYLGIDPTASSIHVGNLVPYMLLNRLATAGHKVILLLGGGTALIGDPGGKSVERPFVSAEIVAKQAEAMEAGIRRFVSPEVTFVNNHDWLSKLSMIEYLRDVGKHFTVNAMVKKDIVANRLTDDNSISYTEFSYSLLQAYDYHYLYKEHGCDLQIGGSDQWGNIIAGVDFIRRKEGAQVHALTMPLVVDKATGKKFGKSEGNAIWLNEEKTSPYEFYQFWLNTSDESVVDYLKLFTFMSLEEIKQLEQQWQADPGARLAQKQLAQAVTTFVHGESVAQSVAKVSKLLFGEGELSDLDEAEREVLIANAPTHQAVLGSDVVSVVVEAGLASSKREARTFVESGAVAINGVKTTDIEAVIDESMFSNSLALVKRGKNQFCVLQLAA